jgi:hypothetical protein
MVHFVACPVCGGKISLPESGRETVVRCGCGHAFPARIEESTPNGADKQPRRTKKEKKPAWQPRGVLPHCPKCRRQVSWTDPQCPYCGEEFADEADHPERLLGRKPGRLRRDAQPHRGPLLAHLGNITLLLSWVGCCTVGVTSLVAFPLALVTITLTSLDLARMERGELDPEGKDLTRAARGSAVSGLLIGLLVVAMFVVVWILGEF